MSYYLHIEKDENLIRRIKVKNHVVDGNKLRYLGAVVSKWHKVDIPEGAKVVFAGEIDEGYRFQHPGSFFGF